MVLLQGYDSSMLIVFLPIVRLLFCFRLHVPCLVTGQPIAILLVFFRSIVRIMVLLQGYDSSMLVVFLPIVRLLFCFRLDVPSLVTDQPIAILLVFLSSIVRTMVLLQDYDSSILVFFWPIKRLLYCF
jgi:hypothetical protein